MREPNHSLSNGWIVAARPKPDAEKRLYCFSHAGVGGAAFRGWGEAAANGLEVCTIQLPGRESRLRETPLTSVHELVGPLAHAIAAMHASDGRPFAFYGHSMGAMVSFETARELRRQGHLLPEALFIGASRAPQLGWPHASVQQLDDVALLTEVNRRYGSVPAIIIEDADLRALLTPTLRADMSVVETYRLLPEQSFEFPIIAFVGDRDPMVARAEMEGWGEQTSGVFQLRTVPGDHIFLQTQRELLLDEVARILGIGYARTTGATDSAVAGRVTQASS
jgi:medium-chain acyl-[acyl-carrier-protein] hydrolase